LKILKLRIVQPNWLGSVITATNRFVLFKLIL